MNKEYLKELYNKVQSGDVLSTTEIKMVMAYQKMEEYGHDWIEIDNCKGVDGEELIDIMKKINIEEIFIDREWSNQFENWYNMQEAGLEIVGMRRIDNPIYNNDIKKWGNSDNKETKIVLVFRLKK
jgi:iron only hydrogenase large subunit-like protein